MKLVLEPPNWSGNNAEHSRGKLGSFVFEIEWEPRNCCVLCIVSAIVVLQVVVPNVVIIDMME